MNKILLATLCCSFGAANAGTLLTETFDPIDATAWTITGGTTEGSGHPEFLDGNALRFSGDNERSANTTGYDVSSGGVVSFNLKIGGSNDTSLFENADSGEDVFFNYSINDGATWNLLHVFDTEDLVFSDTWGLANIDITGAAATTNTLFQWIQSSHNDSRFDHWAIDNVTISNDSVSAVPLPAAAFLFGPALLGFMGFRRKAKVAA